MLQKYLFTPAWPSVEAGVYATKDWLFETSKPSLSRPDIRGNPFNGLLGGAWRYKYWEPWFQGSAFGTGQAHAKHHRHCAPKAKFLMVECS